MKFSYVSSQESISMKSPLQHELMWGTLLRKLELARFLFDKFGHNLKKESAVLMLLARLASRQKAVSETMARLLLPGLCETCAGTNSSGGCCSRFMADENDGIGLLINLLAGIDVRIVRPEPNDPECFFLGTTGCILAFKPFFCLNYLCRRIIRSTSVMQQQELARDTGLLLQDQFAMEQLLSDRISRWHPAQQTNYSR
jgi:hypothetical protein